MYSLATKSNKKSSRRQAHTSDVNKAKRLLVRRAVCPVGSTIGYHSNS